jgi:diguanylate cyclase (GGDEF)-like protein
MTSPRILRRTIGVLVGWHVYDGPSLDPTVTPFLRGIQSAAQANNVNLLIAAGLNRHEDLHRLVAAWPLANERIDFVPVGDANTDGLIIIPPLRIPECQQEVGRLTAKGFPVLFLGAGYGTPSIVTDNEGGIRSLMEHLHEHGHRRIAFVSGPPKENEDSRERLDAYRDSIRALGLEEDPLLIESGRHTLEGGYAAMRRIIQTGAEFTAVVASNDASANGVMRALFEIGLRIPQDVCVAGFNEQADTLPIGPQLTSVHFPMFESGACAVRMLLRLIEAGPGAVPDVTRMSTWLVKRQSCGCIAGLASHPAYGATRGTTEDLAQRMADAVLAEAPSSDPGMVRTECERLMHSLARSLEDDDPAPFQVSLTGIVRRVDAQDDDAHAWQAAISVLHERLPISMQEASARDAIRTRGEDLLHQARAMLSDSARRRQTRLQMQYANRLEAMGRLITRLMASTNEEQILTGLTEGLFRMGVLSAHAAFLHPSEGDPHAESIIRSPHSNRSPLHFATRAFPPEGLYAADKPYQAVLLPLVVGDDQVGYLAFGGQELDPLATITRQVAAMLAGVHLEARLKKLVLRDAVTGLFTQRYFNLILREESRLCRQNIREISVILVDVDAFNRYNSMFGFAAGDEALRELGRSITCGARRGLDVITRFGKDEFALILPETGMDGARRVAKEIQRQVGACPNLRAPLTVSLGVASANGVDADAAILMRRAYQARNAARATGSSQIMCLEYDRKNL